MEESQTSSKKKKAKKFCGKAVGKTKRLYVQQ